MRPGAKRPASFDRPSAVDVLGGERIASSFAPTPPKGALPMRARLLLAIVSIATFGLSLQMPAAHASTILLVDQDGLADPFDCSATTSSAYTTIQSAVDAAAPDDFIVVCP